MCLNWCHLGPGLQFRFDVYCPGGNLFTFVFWVIWLQETVWSSVQGLELRTGSLISSGSEVHK